MNNILKASLLIIIMLTFIQVVVSNTLSTTGTALGKLEDQIASYQKQNQLLKEQLLAKSSLVNLSQEAEKLGFSPSKSQVVISTSLPIALKP